jgi:glutamine phosphoribosylpyrophosphate amidotransferase
VALGLHALQHRGQEAAGIVSYDGTQFHVERHIGLIGDTFTKQSVIDSLKGNRAIGHTRYATTGGAACATCSRCSPSLPAAASPSPTTATSPTR